MLIWSPMGQKKLAVLMGWPYYWDRLKFHDLRAAMTNTSNITFAFLKELFSLILSQPESRYCIRKFLLEKTTENFLQ